ncbi:MAG TPA: hypothetical protein VEQ37_08150, partial [Actinomycetota bacterium]|nr:hypothetical protein [Actinomycetota bacterium]
GGVAFVLAIAHVLGASSFFISLAVVTVGLWALALRRGRLREHGRAIHAEWRDDRLPLAAGLLVLLGFAVVRLTFSPLLHMQTSTAWRYWADAVEIAEAGKIPSRVLQYGVASPSVVNKVYLNTLNAGLSYVIGKEPLPAMAALEWVGSVGLALVLWSLGRELGLRFTAAVLPILLLSNVFVLNTELTDDLTTYKAETFSRLVAFLGAAMAVRAFRSMRWWKDTLVAGLLLGVAAGIHIIPVIIAVAMVAVYAIARLLADHDLKRTLQVTLAAAGVTLAAGAAILVLPHGDIGLQGAAAPGGYDVFAEGFDPTLYLNGGVVPGQRVVGPRTFYLSPRRALDRYVHSAIGLRSTTRSPPGPRLVKRLWVPGLVLGGLLAAVAILLWFPNELKPVGLTAWGLGAAIVMLTWLFSLRYHLYIPAWFGVRRLFDYSSIPLVLIALVLAEGALLTTGRVRPWLAPVAGSIMVLVVAAALLIDGRAKSPDPPAVALVAGFDWIREHTPCDARFLPNAHSEGVFEALTGRVAVLEGATPFLRPSILQPIVRLLLQARGFFQDPRSHEAFLRAQGIDYVVVLTGGHVGYRESIGTIDTVALGRLPSLLRVFANDGMTIYRVASSGAVGRSPDPAAFPGYDCRRGTMAT